VKASVLAPKLEPSGTIGVVAPATPAQSRAQMDRGVEWWESHGYRVKLGPSALERGRDFAGSADLRAEDLQQMFADPEIGAIQCVRGGFGSTEVVPLLDYEAIAASPKAFVGISDITALHAALLRRAGLATFYGPSLTSVAARPVPSLTGDELLRVLTSDGSGSIPFESDGPFVRAIAGGRATGPLVGGCLSDLQHTFGTPWEVQTEGAILFLEEAWYGPSLLERCLIHLRQAEKLDGVVGIVVGEMPYSDWGEGIGPDWPRVRTLDDVLDERLGGLGVPVLYGLACGHGSVVATLPLGVDATLDADAGALTIGAPALVAA
jgi:muramoyltetrapeptide carboxypeptidase